VVWLPGSACDLAPYGVALGVFRPLAVRLVTQPAFLRSWSCKHPRGSHSRDGVGFQSRAAMARLWLPTLPPLEFATPSTLPDRGIHFPARLSFSAAQVVAEAPAWMAECLSRASSRVSTPTSVRLRRFSRPWRFTPPRTLRSISTAHAPEVRSTFSASALSSEEGRNLSGIGTALKDSRLVHGFGSLGSNPTSEVVAVTMHK
jgi:hypothetical protein